MESEKRINWLSLFIKIVIVFIFVLIVIWLISKIIGNNKLSDTFKNNINNMEKVSIDYFKTIDLPLEKGQSIKVTLEELIDKELIVATNSDSDNTCDIKGSYSEIIREKSKYIVTTTLKCGKEKDTIKEDFPLKDCKNCNKGSNNNKKEEKNENTTENKDKENNNSTSKDLTYYEHVKETTEYTKWMRGSLTGDNIENRYEYYGVDYQTYYTIGVIPSDEKTVTYTLKLNSVPNSRYYFTTIKEVANYSVEDELNYLNENNISIYEGNEINKPTENIYKYSLGEANITYKLSPYYREGSFYIRFTITVNNTDGVSTYYDNKLQDNAYLIPLKINVKFASNEIKDTKPTGKYETISYYRYVIKNKETIWSTKNSVKGYTKTGNTKVQ